MKYCSYCGSELASEDVIFCANCGKKLPPHEAGITEPLTEEMRPESVPEKAAQEKKPEKETKPSKGKKKKYRLEAVPKEPTPVDDGYDGYDGYYDDVLPPDMDRVREGLDKELIKKIVALGVGVVLIISLCVVMMYLL